MTTNLLEFDRSGLLDWFAARGEKPFRARQVMRWVHQRGERDFAAMSDLAKPLRAWLQRDAEVSALPVQVCRRSNDGTVKWLFDVGGGNAVEIVFIP